MYISSFGHKIIYCIWEAAERKAQAPYSLQMVHIWSFLGSLDLSKSSEVHINVDASRRSTITVPKNIFKLYQASSELAERHAIVRIVKPKKHTWERHPWVTEAQCVSSIIIITLSCSRVSSLEAHHPKISWGNWCRSSARADDEQAVQATFFWKCHSDARQESRSLREK